jgi:hypothetical protein
MYHLDDDELDRALMALPLEPLPDGLRHSILAAVTIEHHPILTRWETVGLGLIMALGSWLSLLLVNGRTGAGAGSWMNAATASLVNFLTNPTSLVWLSVGVAAAICISFASIPRRVAAES